PAAAEDGRLLATRAARAGIRDLEEGMSPLHDRRGSLQDRGRGADRVKEEIVRLGVTYRLASKHTSFVAVERRAQPVSGQAQLRRVPIALTSGWGGTGAEAKRFRAGSATGVTGAFPAVAPAAMSAPARKAAAPAAPRSAGILGKIGIPWPLAKAAPAETPSAPSAARPLDRLIALQRADGSW